MPSNAWAQQCAKIKDGTIKDSANVPLRLGYDQYGYNYQAHMFNGTYDSVDRVLDGKYFGSTGDYVDDALIMKWSDEWLSNVDCNNDGKLDRGPTFFTSRGWTTNQIEGDYIGADGESHHYTYFVKIVWVGPVPTDGPDPYAVTRIWGEFAVIQEIYNDPYGGFHGVDRTRIGNPAGFGAY
jgi:hypothetical protein